MTTRKRFGRVRVCLDEIDGGVIDFAKKLKAQAPADEPAEAQAVRAPLATVAAERPPPVMRNDGIEGDDMSDGEDDVRGGDKKTKGGRGIFESIIAKWSSLGAGGSVPVGGGDSDDDGAGENEAGEENDGDSGDICPPLERSNVHTTNYDAVQLNHCSARCACVR